jgi:hypothetical protein
MKARRVSKGSSGEGPKIKFAASLAGASGYHNPAKNSFLNS